MNNEFTFTDVNTNEEVLKVLTCDCSNLRGSVLTDKIEIRIDRVDRIIINRDGLTLFDSLGNKSRITKEQMLDILQ